MRSRGSSEYKLLTRLFFRLLPYQVLLLIISAGNGIIDSLHASNFIGKTAMAAIGLYAPLDHFMYAASIILVSGSQLLCGKYLARGQKESMEAICSTDLTVSLLLSLAISGAMVLVSLTDLTASFVKEETERAAFNQYLLGQSLGIPALLMGQQLFSFLSMENQTRRTTLASVACMATNLVLDTTFLAVLRMGTLGLALASALSYWVFLGIQAQYFLSGKADIRFSFSHPRWREVLEIVRIGYPGALSRFAEVFRCLIVNGLILAFVGSVGLSSFAAVNSVMAVFWPVPFGMTAVLRMILSISLGEEDRRSVTNIMHIVLTKGVLVTCGITALLVLLAAPITMLFYRDPADPIFGMTVSAFRILPFCMPFAMVSLSFACYAQATEKKVLATVLPLFDGGVFVSLFASILIPAFGMNGLYFANILNGCCCCLVILLFATLFWKHFPKTLEQLLMIPDSFGAAENERIDISITQLSEVVSISSRVIDFCRERGIDERRAQHAGLALEEMAGNIVEHGFTKDSRPHSVDIRVIHRGDDIVLRLRDNCRAFNPSERFRLFDPADPAKSVGLRLVYGMDKDVSYQNLLGLNVLTVRI